MIVQRTGWTWDYVLGGTSWLNIRMMLADSIRIKSDAGDEVKEVSDDELLSMNED